jgi:hypothetical protein
MGHAHAVSWCWMWRPEMGTGALASRAATRRKSGSARGTHAPPGIAAGVRSMKFSKEDFEAKAANRSLRGGVALRWLVLLSTRFTPRPG